MGMHPEQVQDFTPTPMTLATAMFYLGFDPYTGRKVYVARDLAEKRRQKDYFFRTGGRAVAGRERSRTIPRSGRARRK